MLHAEKGNVVDAIITVGVGANDDDDLEMELPTCNSCRNDATCFSQKALSRLLSNNDLGRKKDHLSSISLRHGRGRCSSDRTITTRSNPFHLLNLMISSLSAWSSLAFICLWMWTSADWRDSMSSRSIADNANASFTLEWQWSFDKSSITIIQTSHVHCSNTTVAATAVLTFHARQSLLSFESPETVLPSHDEQWQQTP